MKVPVSVIISVYNMPVLIEKTIDSVEKQTLKNLEIIIIDDGSTDNTYDVVMNAAKKYDNIKVVHTENQGLGPARNLGIDLSKGEYVAFLDADDTYSSDDSLEYLYKTACENQAVICGGTAEIIYGDDGPAMQEWKSNKIVNDGFVSAVDMPDPYGLWTNIFKKSFLDTNNLRFYAYYKAQDIQFFSRALVAAGKIYKCRKRVYNYLTNYKPLKYTERKAVDCISSLRDVLKIAVDYNLPNLVSCPESQLRNRPGVLLLHFCAQGNKKMLSLLSDFNVLFKKLGRNDVVPASMDAAIETIEKYNEEKTKLLARWNENGIYIYGAGTVGSRFLQYLRKNKIEPKAFIVTDKSRNNDVVYGIPVVELKSLSKEDVNDSDIVVSVGFPFQTQILETLKSSGYERYYPLDVHALYYWDKDEVIIE